MNKHCTCELAGFCTRHQITKTAAQVEICKGDNDRPDCGYKFWEAWETGKFGATAQSEPMLDDWECDSATPVKEYHATRPRRRLGDHIEAALSAVGITKERVAKAFGGCGGCGRRQVKLNQLDEAAREFAAGAIEAGTKKIKAIFGDASPDSE